MVKPLQLRIIDLLIINAEDEAGGRQKKTPQKKPHFKMSDKISKTMEMRWFRADFFYRRLGRRKKNCQSQRDINQAEGTMADRHHDPTGTVLSSPSSATQAHPAQKVCIDND